MEKTSSVDLTSSSSNNLNEAIKKRRGHLRSESARDFKNSSVSESSIIKGIGPAIAEIIQTLKDPKSCAKDRLGSLNNLVSVICQAVSIENYFPLEVIFDSYLIFYV